MKQLLETGAYLVVIDDTKKKARAKYRASKFKDVHTNIIVEENGKVLKGSIEISTDNSTVHIFQYPDDAVFNNIDYSFDSRYAGNKSLHNKAAISMADNNSFEAFVTAIDAFITSKTDIDYGSSANGGMLNTEQHSYDVDTIALMQMLSTQLDLLNSKIQFKTETLIASKQTQETTANTINAVDNKLADAISTLQSIATSLSSESPITSLINSMQARSASAELIQHEIAKSNNISIEKLDDIITNIASSIAAINALQASIAEQTSEQKKNTAGQQQISSTLEQYLKAHSNSISYMQGLTNILSDMNSKLEELYGLPAAIIEHQKLASGSTQILLDAISDVAEHTGASNAFLALIQGSMNENNERLANVENALSNAANALTTMSMHTAGIGNTTTTVVSRINNADDRREDYTYDNKDRVATKIVSSDLVGYKYIISYFYKSDERISHTTTQIVKIEA